jgi:hypothetical protein
MVPSKHTAPFRGARTCASKIFEVCDDLDRHHPTDRFRSVALIDPGEHPSRSITIEEHINL